MVRAPCCEKMGLKKGPWTREEDNILINYINLYGHGNWRALPKLAGLLRCGKSCRLRWTNYLRPDIKRGNFSREEEETIIKLHAALGNRWSAIAARLPGRTDNEIKNVWHTHLKKRVTKPQDLLPKPSNNPSSKPHKKMEVSENKEEEEEEEEEEQVESPSESDNRPVVSSPQDSCSEISSVTTTSGNNVGGLGFEGLPEMDEEFWSEVFSGGNSGESAAVELPQVSYDQSGVYKSNMNDDMEFWFNIFTRAEELPELPEIYLN